MRTFLIFLAVLSIGFVMVAQESGYAKTNSLIVLDYESGRDFTESAIALVNTHCGEIYHVFKGKVLLGYIPVNKVNLLIGRAGIQSIYQNQTEPNRADPIVNCAIKTFNNLLLPVKEATEDEIQKKGWDQWKDTKGFAHLNQIPKLIFDVVPNVCDFN